MKKTFIIGTLILYLGTQCWGSELIKNELKAISNKLSGKTSVSTLIPSIKVYKDNIIEPSATHIKDITGTNYKYSLKTVSKYLSSNKEGLKYANIVEFKMPKTFEYDEVNETKIWKRGNKVIKVVSLIHDVNYHTGEVGLFDPDDGSKIGTIDGKGSFDPVTEHYKVINRETGRVYFDEKIETVWDYNKETNVFDFYDTGEYSARWLGQAEGIEEYNIDTMKKTIYKPNGEKVITAELQTRILDKHTGAAVDEWRTVIAGEIPVHYEMNEGKTRVIFYRDSNDEPFEECGVEIKTVPGTDNVKAYYTAHSGIFLESVEGGEVGSV